jgi:hypothetical protein
MGCARAIAEKGLSSSGVHKRSAPPGADFRVAYFSEVLIESKLVLSLEPTPCTAVMMAIAMPAAIRPYSIAVAPDSSLKNAKTKVFMMVQTPLLMIRSWGIPGAIRVFTGKNLRCHNVGAVIFSKTADGFSSNSSFFDEARAKSIPLFGTSAITPKQD